LGKQSTLSLRRATLLDSFPKARQEGRRRADALEVEGTQSVAPIRPTYIVGSGLVGLTQMVRAASTGKKERLDVRCCQASGANASGGDDSQKSEIEGMHFRVVGRASCEECPIFLMQS
jgi:hypothetical protein